VRGRRAALLAASVCIGGCGSLLPGSTSSAPTKIVRAQATHEYPSAPPAQSTARSFASPSLAILAFTTAYINWTAPTVSAIMRALAADSIGQARSATELAAGETGHDYELQRDGIANSGTVQALAPELGQTHAYVVVTREQTTATGTTAYQGLPPAWHVTLVTVAQLASGGWVVSSWEPEN
jgi:hypothetical protein